MEIKRNQYRNQLTVANSQFVFSRVFPKVDHSARSDRIVLVEYTTGSVVELNFC